MKKCKECGVEFEPKNPKGIFCSNKCKQIDYRNSIKAKLELLKKMQGEKVDNKEVVPPAKENVEEELKDEPQHSHNSTSDSPKLKFATLLQMAKNGIENVEAFREVVSKAKLPPNQRDLILSKLKQ